MIVLHDDLQFQFNSTFLVEKNMRLGLDIGTNSIGWCLFGTDGNGSPTVVIDSGARIFSDGRDPKSGASLAVDRRIARSARRRRDRFLRRRTVLMQRLAAAGLMPADPIEAKKLELLDPYELRARGLDESLPLSHLGRAIFHLNQRRGFKSNRKTDGDNTEGGLIQSGTERLDQAIMTAGARTFGEFLHQRRSTDDQRKTPAVRTRVKTLTLENNRTETLYDFYPDRRHLEEEFTKLWAVQEAHHPDVLDEALRASLFETIFYQRPLKAPKVGRCLFLDEPRLAKSHPLTQRRVLYETVNNLRVSAPGQEKVALTKDQRDTIILALDQKKHTKSMAGMAIKLKALGKVLKLQPDESFTLETLARDAITCDLVRASLSHPKRFGSNWSTLDHDAQWGLIQRLREEEDRDALILWLKAEYGLDSSHAEEVADAPLPEGYGRIGETATRNILEHLKGDVLTYNQAVEACGWNHSDHRTGEVLDRLPYYGDILDRHVIPGTQEPSDDDITRYGRITNPTVHIGLNQLRRLVNQIIQEYGKPDQIVVELARELKQSADQKRETQVTIKKNTSAAIMRGKKLVEELGQPDNGANRMRLRLWEELGTDPLLRLCPYTGIRISAGMLFTGEIEDDHILPYSRTLDDSISNRTLCMREANHEKRNRTPWEAWKDTAQWAEISANLKNLNPNKQWRFAPDAMERFEANNGFLDRQLIDTQYLSRIARQYLDALYTKGGHVWVVPGRLTEMLRRHWGLNSLLSDHNQQPSKKKNRNDHRHHAIDAAVIAATDRGLIKRISDMAKAGKNDGLERFTASVPPPWEGFRNDLRAQLDQIIVSHRADHGRIDPASRKIGRDTTSGQLHNDTAYGLTGKQNDNGVPLVVTRKPIDSLTSKMIEKIRDTDLQHTLRLITKGKESKEFDAAIKDFVARPGPYQGIRHVRLIEALDVIAIQDRDGQPTKGYKGDSNLCYEIWELPDGKFKPQVITTFEAHQAGPARRPHPAAKRVLRVFKRDMVALDHPKFGALVCYVQKISLGSGLILVPHAQSNADARNRDKSDPFKMIQMAGSSLIKANIRRIHVNEIGQIRDPGPRDSR